MGSLKFFANLQCIIFACFLTCLANTSQGGQSTEWRITHPKWTTTDEKSFQDFIVRIGTAVEHRDCNTVTACMKSEANLYRTSDPHDLSIESDCADLPYVLRAYFSWKNGLPFSFAQRMTFKVKPETPPFWKFWVRSTAADLRYSVEGNLVAERFNVIPTSQRSVSATQVLQSLIPDHISSASFRTDIDHPNTQESFADFYPLAINRKAIVPGVVIYDPNGHVTVVYKVTDDGRVYYLDAHPDNTLTTGVYNSKFMRSRPGQGGGFKAWRPIELLGYSQSSNGSLIGGQIVATPNESLPNFSAEQFFGNANPSNTTHSSAHFVYKGREFEFYEWVRMSLSLGDLKFNPVQELDIMLTDLCQSVQNRIQAVDIAIAAGIHNQPHPAKLPQNIYGTDGEWETYSSPSRDAILKTTFRETYSNIEKFIRRYNAKDPQIVYTGTDLLGDLARKYIEKTSACQLSYRNSNGVIVGLNLDDVRKRLYDLSFDPYHCPELRWGGRGNELATCRDNEVKRLWYTREQRLRNQIDRLYNVRMDFTLDDLAKPLDGNGTATQPMVDLFTLFTPR